MVKRIDALIEQIDAFNDEANFMAEAAYTVHEAQRIQVCCDRLQMARAALEEMHEYFAGIPAWRLVTLHENYLGEQLADEDYPF